MSMVFRPAAAADLDGVEAIYGHIFDRQEGGVNYNDWQRGVYPTWADAEEALLAGTLYVAEEDGVLGAAANLNHRQLPEYDQIPWTIPADGAAVFVVHTLCVDPAWSGRGVGGAFVRFAEDLGRAKGCKALRLDTFEKNAPAIRLYTSLGYRLSGRMDCLFTDGKRKTLVGFEKAL